MVRNRKKLFAWMLIAVLLLVPCGAFAKQMRVFDTANLFTGDEIAALETQIADAISDTGYDFVILTGDDTGSKSSIAYADDFYDAGGFGTGEDHSGILYFIDMDNRVPTISTCGGMIDVITDARLETLLDIAYKYLVQGEYAASCQAVIDAAVTYAKDGVPEGQYRVDAQTGEVLSRPKLKLTAGEAAFAVFAGAVVYVLLRIILRTSYTLRGMRSSYDLYANSSCSIEHKEDRYLRSHVIHKRRDPPPSSGSSGGDFHSSSRSSSVHRSSSGRTHGGGSGRKF